MRFLADLKNKKTFVIVFSLILFSVVSINAVVAEQLVFYDNFNNYEAKTYSGRDGPGIWVQESLAPATYSIAGGAYKITSSGGLFSSKAILDFYRIFSKPWPPSYEGPNDYVFSVGIKIDSKGGGVIFRAKPGSQQGYWTYYEVRINKDNKKVTLSSVYEDPSNPTETLLKTVDFPSDVNINDFFRLQVRVQGQSIQVYIAGKKIIDVTSNLNPAGGVGLMVFEGGGTASFDWAELDILTATVTTTVSEPATTVTTTATTTLTSTTRLTETLTETVTEMVTGAASTHTVTAPGATFTETVTSISTVTATQILTMTQTQQVPSRCLIATAAFGSEIAPQVQALREFRDNFVLKTFAGDNFMKAFNAFYYSWSPYVAQAEYENEVLRKTVRFSIYPLLWILDFSKRLAEPFSAMPEFSVLICGLVASFLIGLVYVSPIIVAVALILRYRGWSINTRLTYPLTALLIGLAFFALAEILVSPLLMMIASSIVVLSSIAFTSLAPIRLLPINKR